MSNPGQSGNSPIAIFAKRLKNQRNAAEMTAKQLAGKAKVSAASISEYESGKGNLPPVETLQKLARALGMRNPLAWLERQDAERKDIVGSAHETEFFVR